MANVGPVFGHNNHFRNYAPEKVPYGIKRFGDEAHRLYGVLNKRLQGREYVADEYSIADMALIGWVKAYEKQGVEIEEFPQRAELDRPHAGAAGGATGDRDPPRPAHQSRRTTRRRRRSCSANAHDRDSGGPLRNCAD